MLFYLFNDGLLMGDGCVGARYGVNSSNSTTHFISLVFGSLSGFQGCKTSESIYIKARDRSASFGGLLSLGGWGEVYARHIDRARHRDIEMEIYRYRGPHSPLPSRF